ncbi:MAG TPA: penicillin acylase family protein [Falsiroseomonas sp.]|jgi:penicillin amidase|nr:penicillin acylase family protein [Falsiroseomonas sp.]
MLRAARSFAILAGALLRQGRPRPRNLAQRLATIPLEDAPLERPVALRWNRHQVPWIEAETDHDAAVALGIVHAHLRLGQMEVLRHVALGRTAELVGPVAVDVDRALRSIGITRAVPGILAAMAPETRRWLDGFVAGLNHHARRLKELPPDCALLGGVGREPWTAEDVMAVGRAAVADVNWVLWLKLMRLRHESGWPDLWERLMTHGTGSVASLSGRDPEALFGSAIALAAARCGSNAWAVAGGASASGGAMLASDPHLPITLPNIWLAAGYRCPSYHVVGLMLPGLPFVAIGRNPWLAWGGTSPHAAVSDLFDLSATPAEITATREEVIRVRGGANVRATLRETRWGPLVSDALPMRGGPFALRWVGHDASDELGAMLAMNRARDFDAFAAAAEMMAVPGQNFVVAEAAGSVAKQIAGKYPRRPLLRRAAGLTEPPEAIAHWRGFATARDFPPERDPPRGFVVSANDRPAEMAVPVSFFFSPVDRAERLSQVLAEARPVTLDAMAALQRDVRVTGSLALRDRLLRIAGSLQAEADAALRRDLDAVLPLIGSWNGSYPPDSRAALAFELLLAHLSEQRHSEVERALYAAIWTARTLIAQDLDSAEPDALRRALALAFRKAARDLGRWRVWGDIHRLHIAHPLGTVPVFGRRLIFADLPVGGTSDAVMKTAHPAVPRRHRVFFGSIARFVTDLAEPDSSRMVLLGGQDGWLGSDTLLDQLPLWREGGMIRLPMTAAGIQADFPHLQVLQPRHGVAANAGVEERPSVSRVGTGPGGNAE